jgi:beta-barrel assembly-enhancing protease
MDRRDFLWLLPGIGATTWLQGCATDPVTGKQSFVMIDKSQEVAVDKQNSPHQFSEDYGITQDAELNQYVAGVGKQLASRTHRPDMPYAFQAVNANYVNAYAFPGGSIACTRGILLEMETEDQLAALLGHELGHVNARHFAESQAKGSLVDLAVAGVSIAAASKNAEYGQIAQMIGGLGGGALLAKYSRDNEREADALGIEYMTRGGYNPDGMTDLMAMLNAQSKSKPNALEMMFATHPMSAERMDNTKKAMQQATYAAAAKRVKQRQRYMDQTSRLRAMKPVIAEEQKAESMLAQKTYDKAEGFLKTALATAPNDYPGLVLMAKTQLAMERPNEAQPYLDRARSIYPAEAQAAHLTGVAQLKLNRPESALAAFRDYERLLPGNANTMFLQGYSMEMMQDKKGAAQAYYRYLQLAEQGKQASYAYTRLKAWGAVK